MIPCTTLLSPNPRDNAPLDYQPIPGLEVWESCSEFAWKCWDAAKRQFDPKPCRDLSKNADMSQHDTLLTLSEVMKSLGEFTHV